MLSTGRRASRGRRSRRRAPSCGEALAEAAPLSYALVELAVPTGLEEQALGLVAREILGAEQAPASMGWQRLRLYFADSDAATAAGERLAPLLNPWRLPPPRVTVLADGRWAERYQAGLRPFPLGRGFTVVPGVPARTGARPAGPHREILLVPGRAFGTGEHPTTRLCAAELERRVAPGTRWIDLGCGSGILAIVALHCGASDVLAVDNDPEAVAVARQVLRANGAASRIRLRTEAPAGGRAIRCDGLVVNISASYLTEHAANLAALVRPGGCLIASGFLIEELGCIRRSLRQVGLRELARRGSKGWGLLSLCRAPAGS